MVETEDKERDAKRKSNNLNMDNFCLSPVTTNIQRNIVNVPDERQISLDILVETITGFKGLTLHSTINDYEYCNSKEDDAESDSKNYQ